MNIQSINPATGAILENFPETGGGEIERTLAAAYKTFQQWRRNPFRGTVETDACRRAHPARAQRKVRAHHGARDGQADGAGRGRSREVRLGLRLLRRATREAFLADEPRQTDATPQLRALRPARRRCWRSCRGTFPSGRSSASRRRR